MFFLFFAIIYPFHLHYQEQFQLFLFSDSYLFRYLSKPGGVADYLGNFFTQFFFYAWGGALILAILLTLLQRLVWVISSSLGADKRFFALTFIPSLLYMGLLCNESYLLGGLMAMLLMAAFIYFYNVIDTIPRRMVYFFVALPFLYWVAGGLFILLFLFAVLKELRNGQIQSLWLLVFILGGVILSVALPVICQYSFLQYPLPKAFVGVNYYRYPINLPYMVAVTGLLLVLIPFGMAYMSKALPKISPLGIMSPIVVVIAGAGIFIQSMSDFQKENIMEYDFYARMRKWDAIIGKAENQNPQTPLSVTCLNLALAKKNQLGERMFEFYQKGTGGLIPDFQKDYTIPMVAGEVYYHLGFINTARRYAFEAMEALPDYQKSSRALKRLTETAIIKGDYDLVEKYLRILQKTVFYRVWALRIGENMDDELFIERHPEWGPLRNLSLKEDFLFSEKEKDMMLGILFTDNRRHRMAFEYLLAHTLLEGNLRDFMRYFPLMKSIGYRKIPKHFQEALLFVWDLSEKKRMNDIPFAIDRDIQESYKDFRRMQRNSAGKSEIKDHFSDTYWYYYHYRN